MLVFEQAPDLDPAFTHGQAAKITREAIERVYRDAGCHGRAPYPSTVPESVVCSGPPLWIRTGVGIVRAYGSVGWLIEAESAFP